MNFTITKKINKIDSDTNESVETEIIETYEAELSDSGVFNVFLIQEDQDRIHVLLQPWNFDTDGNRIQWNSVEEGIEWYKSQLGIER